MYTFEQVRLESIRETSYEHCEYEVGNQSETVVGMAINLIVEGLTISPKQSGVSGNQSDTVERPAISLIVWRDRQSVQYRVEGPAISLIQSGGSGNQSDTEWRGRQSV